MAVELVPQWDYDRTDEKKRLENGPRRLFAVGDSEDDMHKMGYIPGQTVGSMPWDQQRRPYKEIPPKREVVQDIVRKVEVRSEDDDFNRWMASGK